MRVDNISFRGGVNLRLPEWHPALKENKQCTWAQNMTHRDEYVRPILGTQKYHNTSLGSDPVTAIMPYYDDQKEKFALLCASGESVYKRNPSTNEFTELRNRFTQNSIFSSAQRYEVMYFPSTNDGCFKYYGGNTIYNLGKGATKSPSGKFILYMKEIDRLFLVGQDAIFGQISWCNLSDPETWDGANVQRIKLKDGERVEGAEVLYGKLIIFCTYSIWIYYVEGNEENWKLEQAPTTVGSVAGLTIKRHASGIIYMGEGPGNPLGIYSFDGSYSKYLSSDWEPFFKNRVNRSFVSKCCASLYDNYYELSFPLDFQTNPTNSVTLDLLNLKQDGTYPIFGPHDIGFSSSVILDGRINNKEVLIGDPSDGFIYQRLGRTLKSIDGSDGSLMRQRFISPVYNENSWDTMKLYSEMDIFFLPRGYFDCAVNVYLSYGPRNERTLDFNPNAQRTDEFSVFNNRVYGQPNLTHWTNYLNKKATAIQFEIINDYSSRELCFQSIGYDVDVLHKKREVQSYAF